MKKVLFAVLSFAMASSTYAAAPAGWSEFSEIQAMNVNVNGFDFQPVSPTTTFSNLSCTANVVHVYVNHQGLDSGAVNRLYSAALAAYMSGKKISVYYQVENNYCYASQIRVENDSAW